MARAPGRHRCAAPVVAATVPVLRYSPFPLGSFSSDSAPRSPWPHLAILVCALKKKSRPHHGEVSHLRGPRDGHHALHAAQGGGAQEPDISAGAGMHGALSRAAAAAAPPRLDVHPRHRVHARQPRARGGAAAPARAPRRRHMLSPAPANPRVRPTASARAALVRFCSRGLHARDRTRAQVPRMLVSPTAWSQRIAAARMLTWQFAGSFGSLRATSRSGR
jgi:hypothetical protein